MRRVVVTGVGVLSSIGNTVEHPWTILCSIARCTSRVRSRFGNRPINKRDSVLEGLAILDAGGKLGPLADVNTLQRNGVFVPFFGHLACW
jgi:lauroyl/myristoyl acyltransferase